MAPEVTSPYGNVLHHKENVTHGQFAFTSSESGQYLTCFWTDHPAEGVGLTVNIDWKIGVAAKCTHQSSQIVEALATSYLGPDYSQDKEVGEISLKDIDQVARTSFPLCMQHLFSTVHVAAKTPKRHEHEELGTFL
ncbi:hypothetical protein SSX86_024949 [Deinandra increscens subsp. villosa]|uniref:GOLD domain-containing protein n=1 Tax=Deinandra increscens subsp. villosa TaxID=3103831 RepID=A0AAP0CII5_9ASTR